MSLFGRIRTSRLVRWVVAVAAAVMVFGVCLWLGRSVSFSWMPKAEADRWVVATAFATVVAGAVLTAVGWWAGREMSTPPALADHGRQSVRGSAVGGGISQVSGTGGNVHITRHGPAAKATSSLPLPATSSSDETVPSESSRQAVRETSAGGPVNQVQDTGGDVEIEGP